MVNMDVSSFERARSTSAKQERIDAILRSAAEQALVHGIRGVTLTDVAAGVGMHKSAMLRYFETREEIFLRLAELQWPAWAEASSIRLEALGEAGPASSSDRAAIVSGVLASTLVARPLFCDLLAQVPLNLERGVSLGAVKRFKVVALAAAARAAGAVQNACGVDAAAAGSIIAAATSLAGAFWQMAAPGTALRDLYQSGPELGHAIVDVEPRLAGILTALIRGYSIG